MSHDAKSISKRAAENYEPEDFKLANLLYLELVEFPSTTAIANYRLSLIESENGNNVVAIVGMNLIDVFKKTAGKVGYLNDLFHCAAHHLDSRILASLQDQFG